MNVKIIEQLNTGTITNNYRFGQPFGPATPYNVVRKEIDGFGRGVIFRIFTHYEPGQDLFLDDYADNELIELLDGFGATDRHGNYNILQLLRDQDGQDIITNNDDGTISKERRFLMPSRFF